MVDDRTKKMSGFQGVLRARDGVWTMPLHTRSDAKGVRSYQPGATPQEPVSAKGMLSAKGAIHRTTACGTRVLRDWDSELNRKYETGRWPRAIRAFSKCPNFSVPKGQCVPNEQQDASPGKSEPT